MFKFALSDLVKIVFEVSSLHHLTNNGSMIFKEKKEDFALSSVSFNLTSPLNQFLIDLIFHISACWAN